MAESTYSFVPWTENHFDVNNSWKFIVLYNLSEAEALKLAAGGKLNTHLIINFLNSETALKSKIENLGR